METIDILIERTPVYEEVAKATDYTGSKLIDSDENARDRILAADADLAELGRFWDEAVLGVNDRFKELLVSSESTDRGYSATIEVSRSFDKHLCPSVERGVQSYFIAAIIAQWFKFANKGEANDYFVQAEEMIMSSERLLYSRKRPMRPMV